MDGLGTRPRCATGGGPFWIVAVWLLIQRFAVPQQDIAPFVLFFAGRRDRVRIRRARPGLLATLLLGRDVPTISSSCLEPFTCTGSALIATCLSIVSGTIVGHLLRSPTQGLD